MNRMIVIVVVLVIVYMYLSKPSATKPKNDPPSAWSPSSNTPYTEASGAGADYSRVDENGNLTFPWTSK